MLVERVIKRQLTLIEVVVSSFSDHKKDPTYAEVRLLETNYKFFAIYCRSRIYDALFYVETITISISTLYDIKTISYT